MLASLYFLVCAHSPSPGVKRTMSPLDTNTKFSRKIMRSNKNIKQQKVFYTKAYIAENWYYFYSDLGNVWGIGLKQQRNPRVIYLQTNYIKCNTYQPSYSHSSGQASPEATRGGPGSLNKGPLTSTLTEVSSAAPTLNTTGLCFTGFPFQVVVIEKVNS